MWKRKGDIGKGNEERKRVVLIRSRVGQVGLVKGREMDDEREEKRVMRAACLEERCSVNREGAGGMEK